MYKIIEDKRIKDQSRKATKNQVTYSESKSLESTIKSEKKFPQKHQVQKIQSVKILPHPVNLPQPVKLPQPPAMKLPLPPKINTMNKQQKLKEMQRIQQERQKKALEEVMMRRTSKLQAYRMSKMSQSTNNKKGGVQEIDFLRGIN